MTSQLLTVSPGWLLRHRYCILYVNSKAREERELTELDSFLEDSAILRFSKEDKNIQLKRVAEIRAVVLG